MRTLALVFTLTLVGAAVAQDTEKGKIVGSPTAPVRIDVFSDFACPACRIFHEQTLPMILRDYVQAGKVYVVNREFPLAIEAHKYSRTAANYAVAAGRLGIYGPVADALFRDQVSWNASGKVWETVATVLSPEQQKKVQTIAKGGKDVGELILAQHAVVDKDAGEPVSDGLVHQEGGHG